MAIKTSNLTIPKGEWTLIPLEDARTIIEKISGNIVRYRFGIGSDGDGMVLNDTIAVDVPVEVCSIVGDAVLSIASGD